MKFQISTRNKISLSTQKELYNSEVLLQANLVVVVFFVVEIETKQKECYNLIFKKKNFFFQIRILEIKKSDEHRYYLMACTLVRFFGGHSNKKTINIFLLSIIRVL